VRWFPWFNISSEPSPSPFPPEVVLSAESARPEERWHATGREEWQSTEVFPSGYVEQTLMKESVELYSGAVKWYPVFSRFGYGLGPPLCYETRIIPPAGMAPVEYRSVTTTVSL
jgi:hypothetical protein